MNRHRQVARILFVFGEKTVTGLVIEVGVVVVIDYRELVLSCLFKVNFLHVICLVWVAAKSFDFLGVLDKVGIVIAHLLRLKESVLLLQ